MTKPFDPFHDEAFISEVSIANVEHAWRPRDEDDVDVDPDSLRGSILALYDAYNALPWWYRVLGRVMGWFPKWLRR